MEKEVEQLSKYTTELRYICEMEAGLDKSYGYKKIDDIIQAAIPKVFDFDFPMYDESYRNVLCTKILRHFYTREIGEETYGLWKLRLETKLNEIMPYYNRLYEAGLKDFNPLWDTQMSTHNYGWKEDGSQESEGVRESESNQDTIDKYTTLDKKNDTKTEEDIKTKNKQHQNDQISGWEEDGSFDRYSDTPQGSIESVVTGDYLTNARVIDKTMKKGDSADSWLIHDVLGDNEYKYHEVGKDTTHEAGTVKYDKGKSSERGKAYNAKTTEDYMNNVNGRNGGDVAKALEALRSEFLNIDMMIINDLEPLFMCIW